MLEGGKEFVMWPYEEGPRLSPAPLWSTEALDELFIADGIHRRFDLFPAMAQTRAWYIASHRIAAPFVRCQCRKMVKTNLGRKDSALPYANMKFATHVTRVQHVKCDTKIWHKYALSCRKIAKLHVTYLSIPNVRSMKYRANH